ncbi:MAG: GNAT family N-acetyltransferase [Pyrinomonadaceae bacterium]
MKAEEFEIRPLEPEDAAGLSEMLRSQPQVYTRFFTPFGFDEESILKILARRGQDVYMGVYWLDQIVGFFMLRGWNEGYETPAFGILIDERFRGYGVEMLSLETAKVICKLRGATRIMFKMHPENISIRAVARKTGFIQTGIEARSGNVVYHLEIKRRADESELELCR